MTFRATLIIVSSLLALISPVIYARSIVKGESKPHRTTRFVLFVITVLSTVSLFANHDSVAVWLAGVSAIQATFILILSIRRGMGGWGKIDLACLVIAALGIVAWQTTRNPIAALYFSILADFTGMIPALLKTYRLPHTENIWFFGLDMIAGILSACAVASFTIEQISYPIYIALINLAMVILIARPRLQLN